MADSFGIKLGVEGEKEFKSTLSDINLSFKVLGSEMKLVQSQFGKNYSSVESLTSRNEVLNRQIEKQKEKIATLKSALDNASSSFGENDRQTHNWQIQLNNAETTLNGMEREIGSNNSALEQAKTDIEGTEKSLGKVDGRLDDTAESADDMGNEIKDAGDKADKSKERFSKLGSVLKGVGVAMGAVVTAAAATAVKLGKEVGINNPNPQSALDVTGEIHMNGFPVMGIIQTSVEDDVSLNSLTTQGIYFRRRVPQENMNYPALVFGMLEVFSCSTNLVIQRYTARDTPFDVYIRSKVNSSWSKWVKK